MSWHSSKKSTKSQKSPMTVQGHLIIKSASVCVPEWVFDSWVKELHPLNPLPCIQIQILHTDLQTFA